jgi:hypothetical protein
MGQRSVQGLDTTRAAAALRTLGDGDRVRLMRFAELRARGLPMVEASDLLNEAIARALSTRRWPSHISFLRFMLQTIRSVASEHWRRLEPVSREADLLGTRGVEQDGGYLSPLENIPDPASQPDRIVLALKTLAEIEGLFRDDTEVLAVLSGRAMGEAPAEVRRRARMTPTQYASAQKRLLRMLSRTMLQEAATS